MQQEYTIFINQDLKKLNESQKIENIKTSKYIRSDPLNTLYSVWKIA